MAVISGMKPNRTSLSAVARPCSSATALDSATSRRKAKMPASTASGPRARPAWRRARRRCRSSRRRASRRRTGERGMAGAACVVRVGHGARRNGFGRRGKPCNLPSRRMRRAVGRRADAPRLAALRRDFAADASTLSPSAMPSSTSSRRATTRSSTRHGLPKGSMQLLDPGRGRRALRGDGQAREMSRRVGGQFDGRDRRDGRHARHSSARSPTTSWATSSRTTCARSGSSSTRRRWSAGLPTGRCLILVTARRASGR